MKKELSIILFFTLAILFTNCADDRNLSADYELTKKPHFLSAQSDWIYADKFDFSAKGGESHGINVQSVNVEWAFTGQASWLQINPLSGNTDMFVSLSTDDNISGEDIRTTVFTIAATDNQSPFSKTFSATQVADKPYIVASPTDLMMSGKAGTYYTYVDSNVEWYVGDVRYSSSDKTKDWITVIKQSDNKTLSFIVKENTTNEKRSGSIELYQKSTGKNFESIDFQQSPANLQIESDALNYDFIGGGYELTINSETSWTAETSDSWIDISPTLGEAGESKVIVSTVPNQTASSRSGYVYIKIGSKTVATIPVNQKGIELSVNNPDKKLSYTAGGGKATLSVLSNTDWVVKDYPSWVTVSSEYGTKNQTIEVTAQHNKSMQGRTAMLTIAVDGIDICENVTLEQMGWSPNDFFATLNFNAIESNDTLVISTSGDWSIATDLDWVTFNKLNGTGDFELIAFAADNPSDSERSGYAFLTVNGTVNLLYLRQEGKFFSVSTAQAVLPSNGGTHRVQISTNDNWTASCNSKWMTLSQSSGFGNIDVTLTASENMSLKERSDTTVFQSVTLKKPIKVITKQEGKHLFASTKSIGFFIKGGESPYYHIDTDATYTIITDQPWIKLTHDADKKVFMVSVDENNAEESRKGNVIITMTGLTDGVSYVLNIPVVQYGTAQAILVIPFDKDENWNFSSATGLNVKVTGFGIDEDWNF